MGSLARRPEPTTYGIQDLVDDVRRGKVRIPHFQRSFQWDSDDVVALFDSIYRGFPIGNLLLWRHRGEAGAVVVGPLRFNAPQMEEALFVVDGQQRIISLAGVLLRRGDTGDDRFDVYFDLASEQFVAPGRRRRKPEWLPLHVALDTQTLLEWLAAYPGQLDHPEQVRAATRLAKTLIEYRVPAYIVEATDEATLRIVFDRMNTTGKSLKPADIFNALFAQPSDPPSRVDELSREVSSLGFGTIDDASLLKSILAIEGLDVTQPINTYKGEAALAGATRRASPVLKRVITFLRVDAAIPHFDLLPAAFPIMPLARFSALHPEPLPRSKVLLVRWLWRSVVDHLRRGHHPSRVRRAIDAIDGNEEESIQRLLQAVPGEPFQLGELPDYNWQSGWTKLVLAALAALGPTHLIDGMPVDLPTEITTHAARIVQRIDPGGFDQLHGNRILHAPLERGEGRSIATLLAEGSDAIRESHFVELGPDGRVGVPERESALTDYVNRFVASRMAIVHSDRPSLKHLLKQAADDDAA